MKFVSRTTFAVFLCLGGITFSLCQTEYPIPARPPGYTYMSPTYGRSSKVVLEIFYDHLCSDSKDNWVIMKEVFQQLKDKEVTVLIHIQALPYHHNSFFAQEVGVVVREVAMEKFTDYIQLMFDNQDMFLSGAVNMTEPEVQLKMAQLTADSIGIDQQTIISGFQNHTIKEKAIYAWEYASYRGIIDPPEFIVNGVVALQGPNYMADDWLKFIDKLFQAPY